MAIKLFVGGLSYDMNDDQLRELFAGVGTVVSAQIIIDRQLNRSKGFGFIEMSSDAEAQTAIAELNGKEVSGRALTVNEARPMEPRPPRSGAGGAGFRGGNDRRSNDRPRSSGAGRRY